jgi:hypothetical protein
MTAIGLITDLRAELDGVKSRGQPAVGVAELEAYLAAQEASARGDAAAEQALAKAKHDMEVWKVHAPLQHATNLESTRWAIESGGDALRTLVLINGAAAVALLAFLGNVLAKEPPRCVAFSLGNMKVAMVTFEFGVGFAGVASAARYLTQFSAAQGWPKPADGFNIAAILLGLASLGAFFRGGLWALWAFG